jgi:ABC-2 type transport system permease protein
MNRFAWLMRREFWEHRAIWMAPGVVLAVLLLGAITGNVFLGDVQVDADISIGDDSAAESGLSQEDIDELSSIRGPEDLHKLERLEKLKDMEKKEVRVVSAGEAMAMVAPEKRRGILLLVYASIAILMFFVMGIIAFFYSLEALYADRRDRSVLFWKSLPLSDTETVLSKFAVATVAIPLLAAAAAVIGQLVIAAGGSAKLAFTGGPAGVMWAPDVLAGSVLGAVMLAIVCALWYAPIVAYLLLASSWAPKSPFLWAVLPPAALAMLERIAFGSQHVTTFLGYRAVAPLKAMFDSEEKIKASELAPTDLAANIVDLLLSPGMILGLLVAAGLLAAAIWVRRYRDESI